MTLYDDLGVAKDAAPEEIKRAHRKRVKKVHPDAPEGDTETFRRVQNAFLVLSDPDRRRRYDETGEEDVGARGRTPEEMEKDEAIQTLGGMVIGFLNNSKESDLDYTDMAKALMNSIIQGKRAIEAEKLKVAGQIKRAEKMARRWRRKHDAGKDSPDLIANMMQAQIATLNQMSGQIERALRVNAMVAAMVGEYEYVFDKPNFGPGGNAQNIFQQIAKEELAGGINPADVLGGVFR